MKALEDTVVIIPQKWVQICNAVGHCNNHPVKFILVNETELDTKLGLDTTFVQANKETFEAVISGKYEHPKPVKVLTAFDTIQPCDVSLYPAPTYYTLKSQPVRNTQEMDSPMNYDILFNGVVLSFTLWMSAKYLMICGSAWANLIQELRNELS
jgi:hypothetical protein